MKTALLVESDFIDFSASYWAADTLIVSSLRAPSILPPQRRPPPRKGMN